ncbi:DNA-processing protein DprA [Parafrankia discariae]|uniref:DNA-processing protein DprA n=1 Tax=Parafrankia discariae TaxID=365528 RepID=UPI00036E5BF1|nr:DNA-processing protein DprA [Parafrankia discariae]
MDRLTEHAALLTLLRGRRRQWGLVADEVEETGSALRVLEADTNADQGDLFAGFPDGMSGALDAARETLLGWDAQGIHIVTLLDADYPAQLLTVHQRPPFLFFRGSMSPDDAAGVAVVGTRAASAEGLRRAEEIAAGLARRGRVVVSGLAGGVDTAAHRAALREGGCTVAVIGTGLFKSYPKENAPLQEKLAREHLVLSQFWPESPPTKTSFLMRNGVISGYAAATRFATVEGRWRPRSASPRRLLPVRVPGSAGLLYQLHGMAIGVLDERDPEPTFPEGVGGAVVRCPGAE